MKLPIEIEQAIDNLRSSGGDTGGAYACDAAQEIWNFANEDNCDQLIDYLQSGEPIIRNAVTWAVADARRPKKVLHWLMNNGLLDPSDQVKYWTMVAIKESRLSAKDILHLSLIEELANSRQDGVGALAKSILYGDEQC